MLWKWTEIAKNFKYRVYEKAKFENIIKILRNFSKSLDVLRKQKFHASQKVHLVPADLFMNNKFL